MGRFRRILAYTLASTAALVGKLAFAATHIVNVGGTQPPASHLSSVSESMTHVSVPVRLDPGFSLGKTTNLGRMIEKWGPVPFSYLAMLTADEHYTYGYIGSEDFTMYPILPPGSFVQVDESLNKAAEGTWRSEFERPIYFVETREGYVCAWCHVRRESIVLQPHPLSPVPVRMLRHPQEAEIIGQVVGVAMRLGDWHAPGSLTERKGHSALP